jgi:16S rRNA (cytidine1402-2'-O)-methyltransferase
MPLILLPNLLGPARPLFELSTAVAYAVAALDGLIAESERAGRRFLSAFQTKKPARELPIALMPREWTMTNTEFLISPLLQGEHWGLLSDAGMPCLADPGSQLVRAARLRGIEVRALAGPSAPLLALVLSGFSGQRFAFHGYLRRERRTHILSLQSRAREEGAVQLFMETPYRNDVTLKETIAILDSSTQLAVASDLTLPSEQVVVGPIGWWRRQPLPTLKGRPSIFLLAPAASGRRHP